MDLGLKDGGQNEDFLHQHAYNNAPLKVMGTHIFGQLLLPAFTTERVELMMKLNSGSSLLSM